VNVQIFGFNDDQDTRKARRFFAERRIPVHFVNLDETV
jgi:arsenate reductase-like glutaredoxin family protein